MEFYQNSMIEAYTEFGSYKNRRVILHFFLEKKSLLFGKGTILSISDFPPFMTI
jgi:hypothetical protein